MGTDVASFAKQLREDGIEAAKEEAAKILADARKEAEKIVNSAKSEAAKVEKEAQTRISQNQNSSESEMRMVARDIIIGLKKKIEEIGTALLKNKVAESLENKDVLKVAITELLKNQQSGKNWEVTLSEKVAKPLADTVVALFKENGSTVKLVSGLKKAGFEAHIDGENEVFEVTDESLTESFRKLLSPELKKLLEA
jgi:V/A-type H+-transporting ATPase subunit E